MDRLRLCRTASCSASVPPPARPRIRSSPRSLPATFLRLESCVARSRALRPAPCASRSPAFAGSPNRPARRTGRYSRGPAPAARKWSTSPLPSSPGTVRHLLIHDCNRHRRLTVGIGERSAVLNRHAGGLEIVHVDCVDHYPDLVRTRSLLPAFHLESGDGSRPQRHIGGPGDRLHTCNAQYAVPYLPVVGPGPRLAVSGLSGIGREN